MTKLQDIVFETDHYWVKRVPKGFEVYKTGLTHSTRVAVIGYTGDKGLQRAKDEIARREASSPSVRHHATKKKSPAQLEREIAEVLGRSPKQAVEDAFAEAHGYVPDDRSEVESAVARARSLYGGYSTTDLRRELKQLEARFEKAGGRGVELANRIDAARLILALSSPRSHSTKKSVLANPAVKCPSPEHPLYPELRHIRQVAHDTSWTASQLAKDAEEAFRSGDCAKAAAMLEAAKRVIAKERRKRR